MPQALEAFGQLYRALPSDAPEAPASALKQISLTSYRGTGCLSSTLKDSQMFKPLPQLRAFAPDQMAAYHNAYDGFCRLDNGR